MTTPTLIILAGGSSSRMWPLREKLLMRFGDEPLLSQQLRRFVALSFSDVVIVANAENVDVIRSLSAQVDALNIEVVVQESPLGMGDALLQTVPVLAERIDGPIYVNQIHDIVEDSLHEDMLRAYQANTEASYLAGYEIEDYFPGGYLTVDASGRISGIVEKPGADKRPSNLVNIVAHIHNNAGRLFEVIRQEYAKDSGGDDHYERSMGSLMQTQPFQVVAYPGVWKFIKFPWHVLDVMDYFLSQIKGQQIDASAYVAPTASIVGDVVIGPGTKIFPGAAVVGPAYIGSNVIVGNNALVRSSIVLDGANVGFTTEVARSYVDVGCQMHACRVLDSVFGPNVNFSAGCTTANLRIDKGTVRSMVKGQRIDSGRAKLGAIIGEDAFLGVDAMTMPGAKIGVAAQVGPGAHIYRDVKDRQRVYVKQQLLVSDED